MRMPKTKYASLPGTFSPRGSVPQPRQRYFENYVAVHALVLDFVDHVHDAVGIHYEQLLAVPLEEGIHVAEEALVFVLHHNSSMAG